jgi:hypothetical protein
MLGPTLPPSSPASSVNITIHTVIAWISQHYHTANAGTNSTPVVNVNDILIANMSVSTVITATIVTSTHIVPAIINTLVIEMFPHHRC